MIYNIKRENCMLFSESERIIQKKEDYMSFSDRVIQAYKNAYYDLYETYPMIRRNGSWIIINERTYRAKEVLKMVSKFEKMKERLSNKLNKKENDVFYIKPNGWEKHIKKDLIISLLNKLYEQNGRSFFELEKFIKNFVPSDFNNNNQQLEEKIEELDKQIERMEYNEEFYKNRINNYLKIIKELKNDIKTLKRNSVFFSMEDMP